MLCRPQLDWVLRRADRDKSGAIELPELRKFSPRRTPFSALAVCHAPTVALPSLSPPCRGHVLFAAFAWTALCTLLLSRGHRSAAVPSAQTASACATAGIAVAMWYSHVNFIKPQLQAQAAKLKHGRSTDAEHAGADEGWSQQRRRRGRGCCACCCSASAKVVAFTH